MRSPMKMNKRNIVLFASGFLACAGLIACIGLLSESSKAEAGTEVTPVQKGVYFPNTETLAPNEMRVISCGTGLPTPLTKAQKSACFMVELGNGDIFLFDIGTGSVENLFAIQPRFAKVDTVFISHLHTDHFGDLDALWVGGWGSGRYTPLHVYGPSGAKPELGTAAAVEALTKAYAWDIAGRSGAWPDAGGRMIAHEFDYKQENEIV